MKIPLKFALVVGLSCFMLTGCIPQTGQSGINGKDEYVKGAMVPNFPALPLYRGAQVVESYGFQDNFGAVFISGDDLSKVFQFYNDSLPKLGWDTSVTRKGTDNFTFNIKNDKQQGTVIVNTAADSKKTAITMSISPRVQ